MLLKVEFEDGKVEELFTDLNDVRGSRNLLLKAVGRDLTLVLKRRFNQIAAFSTFAALQQSAIGKMEALEGDFMGSYSLRVSANYRLVVKPRCQDLSAACLKRCDTLIIEGVIDYHGRGKKHNWLIP